MRISCPFVCFGDGTTVDRAVPAAIAGLSSVVDVAASSNNGYVITDDGTVWAWSLNSWGQLGDGTGIDSPTPVQVAWP
jgi:alpha-tubulin suppressor-like RCC1 family protein